MKLIGNKKSKKQKLSLKYNNQKRVREHKRRVKKEAKKLGIKGKKLRKDPGIPNSWPFKAQMLQDLERQKAERDKEMEKRRLEAKEKAQTDRQMDAEESRKAQQEREVARREKRAEDIARQQENALRSMLVRADVFLMALDARDPLRCRCAALEAWAQENGKRFIFVLTKADLVAPQVTAQWIQVLGRVGPVVAVQAEAGREGLNELFQMLGHAPTGTASSPTMPAPATAVGIIGYPQTGKRLLRKAIHHDVRGPVPWMLEQVGLLNPVPGPLDAAALLHLTIRGTLPRTSQTSETDAMTIVEHFLQCISQQTVMRRFRLPNFEGAEGFLRAFAKDRQIKNKAGNEPRPETIAKRFLPEFTVLPGCLCAPPETLPGKEVMLWSAHTVARPHLEAVMQAQIGIMKARDEGPTAGALALTSVGFGPAVDLNETFASLEGDAEMDAADDEDGDDEESEEEEMCEGEEEEDEDEEDDEDDDQM